MEKEKEDPYCLFNYIIYLNCLASYHSHSPAENRHSLSNYIVYFPPQVKLKTAEIDNEEEDRQSQMRAIVQSHQGFGKGLLGTVSRKRFAT